jgi:hypothetical protein
MRKPLEGNPLVSLSRRFWSIVLAASVIFVLSLLELLPQLGDSRIVAAGCLMVILIAVAWRAWERMSLQPELRRREVAHLEEMQRRIASGQRIAMRGASALNLWLAFLVVDGLLVYSAAAAPGGTLIALAAMWTAVVVSTGIVWLPRSVLPILIVSREGIQPAGYGLIAWSDLRGFEVYSSARGAASQFHLMRLWIPKLEQMGDHLPAATRFGRRFAFGKLRQIITVRLVRTDPSPAGIEHLCRSLWRQATGRDYRWSMRLSPEDCDQLVAAHTSLAELRNASAGEDPERTLRAMRHAADQIGSMHVRAVNDIARQQRDLRSMFALAMLFVLYKLVNVATNFSGTERWLMISLLSSFLFVTVVTAIYLRQSARNTPPAVVPPLVRVGKGIGVALFVTFATILTWLVVSSGVGDAASRVQGRVQIIEVSAVKTDRNRRGRCTRRLEARGLPVPICLTPTQFAELPNQVRVQLQVRQGSLGYHVDSHTIHVDSHTIHVDSHTIQGSATGAVP